MRRPKLGVFCCRCPHPTVRRANADLVSGESVRTGTAWYPYGTSARQGTLLMLVCKPMLLCQVTGN
jgi:hypothetical protein